MWYVAGNETRKESPKSRQKENEGPSLRGLEMWRTTTYAMGTSSSSPTVELSSSAASDDLKDPLKDSSAADTPPENDGAKTPADPAKKGAAPKKDKSVDWRPIREEILFQHPGRSDTFCLKFPGEQRFNAISRKDVTSALVGDFHHTKATLPIVFSALLKVGKRLKAVVDHPFTPHGLSRSRFGDLALNVGGPCRAVIPAPCVDPTDPKCGQLDYDPSKADLIRAFVEGLAPGAEQFGRLHDLNLVLWQKLYSAWAGKKRLDCKNLPVLQLYSAARNLGKSAYGVLLEALTCCEPDDVSDIVAGREKFNATSLTKPFNLCDDAESNDREKGVYQQKVKHLTKARRSSARAIFNAPETAAWGGLTAIFDNRLENLIDEKDIVVIINCGDGYSAIRGVIKAKYAGDELEFFQDCMPHYVQWLRTEWRTIHFPSDRFHVAPWCPPELTRRGQVPSQWGLLYDALYAFLEGCPWTVDKATGEEYAEFKAGDLYQVMATDGGVNAIVRDFRPHSIERMLTDMVNRGHPLVTARECTKSHSNIYRFLRAGLG